MFSPLGSDDRANAGLGGGRIILLVQLKAGAGFGIRCVVFCLGSGDFDVGEF